MPPLTLHAISVPVFIRSMTNLSAILKKGVAFADEKGLDHSELVDARLVSDMGNLAYQIQRVSDTAKFTPVRIGGIESVSMDDNEKTFEDMEARLQKTIEFLKGVDPASMNGKEDNEVTIKRGGRDIKMTGSSYILVFALPNFFFHVATAYGILRSAGVPVGKLDFLGREETG